MARLWTIVPALLVSVAVGGCGADESPFTDTERIVRTADTLTNQAAELEEALAAAESGLAAGGTEDPPESILDPLDDQRGRAEDLAERAREDLPRDIPVQDELERAGERLAEAADELSTYADTGDDEALAAARSALASAERLHESAAEQLADRPPDELRELLDQLRRHESPHRALSRVRTWLRSRARSAGRSRGSCFHPRSSRWLTACGRSAAAGRPSAL